MNHTDVDLSTLTKEQLIDIIKKAGRNTRKRPSKQELFENIMIYLESKYKQIPEELIISQLTETERYSITQARSVFLMHVSLAILLNQSLVILSEFKA